ncbi:MAG TPA: PAS domain S-box protein [Terriglobales bacterium]|nr:PAS domain S-box protein [Terriglobales bacterium]
MHHLLSQQLHQYFGTDFEPQGPMLAFLEAVSSHYDAEDRAHSVAKSQQVADRPQNMRDRSNLELANEHALLRRIIDSVPDLIYFKDMNGTYLGCNRAFEEYFGVPETEITGKTDFSFMDESSAVALRKMDCEVLATSNANTSEEWVTYPDGHRACLETVKIRYSATNGGLLGMIGIGRNITERKRLAEQLQLAAFAYDHCSESMMVTDSDNKIVAVNPAFSKMTGYAADEVLGKNPALLRSGLQDQAFYRDMWQTLKTEGCWQGEIWNRRKNGEIFPEWLRINRLYNADGSVHRHVALFSDISEQKCSEGKLRSEKQLLDDIINTLPDIFYVVDLYGSYVRVNRKFVEVTGYPEEELSLATIYTLFDGADRPRFAERIQEAFQCGRLDVEMCLITRGGQRIPCHFTGSRTTINGKYYLVGLGRDISERKRYEQALVEQANVDSLTGLATRRYFMELVEKELARAERKGGPTSVIMLDLDEFKSINDRNGHHVGDQVLRVIGQVCRQSLREMDIVGRIGGEEFAVLLPETDGKAALVVAERLRQAIASAPVHVEHGRVLHFTASIGVDTLHGEEVDVEVVLRSADHALYSAKRAGRNRVCVATRQ